MGKDVPTHESLPYYVWPQVTDPISGAWPGYPASGGQRAKKRGTTGRTSREEPGYSAHEGPIAKRSGPGNPPKARMSGSAPGPGCPAEGPDVRHWTINPGKREIGKETINVI